MKILCKWFGHLRPVKISNKINGINPQSPLSEITGWKCLLCDEYWSEQWDW